MTTAPRLLLLVLLLNLVRYFVAGPLEQWTVLPPLLAAMGESASYFNTSFSTADWVTSFAYNALMWGVAALAFHLMHPRLPGGWLARSLQAFGLMFLFFASVSAVYMNHYSHPKAFYLFNILDGVVAFGVVAVANALLYPRVVGCVPLLGDGSHTEGRAPRA